MPNYRIYRMKDAPRQHFRWAPHVSGAASVKRKEYEEGGQIEAASEYAAWEQLHTSTQPLEVGDLLETDAGDLRICKYIGFETATWILPAAAEPGAAQEAEVATPAAGESHA
jgi:hypothetical protein